MKRLIITCLLLLSVSLVGSAQTSTGPRDLTAAEVAAAEVTAHSKTNALQTLLTLTTVQMTPVYDCELNFQLQFDKYTVNGITPSTGQLGNITIQRDQKLETILTPAQYTLYLSSPH